MNKKFRNMKKSFLIMLPIVIMIVGTTLSGCAGVSKQASAGSSTVTTVAKTITSRRQGSGVVTKSSFSTPPSALPINSIGLAQIDSELSSITQHLNNAANDMSGKEG
ncbi:MAG: hypothetical protein M1483_07945 [Actinobacteria bacterium]|nr:hypothetical protein [Actinomycetota bacterium]MCL6105541.1 hypothetical protein [Actinomycetota bacterium]